jgi:hypothetical protein
MASFLSGQSSIDARAQPIRGLGGNDGELNESLSFALHGSVYLRGVRLARDEEQAEAPGENGDDRSPLSGPGSGKENPNMKTGLLIFLFVVGTLSFKQMWDGKRSLRQKWIYGALAVTCWIAMAMVGHALP